ncbi:hypothetical protein OZX69_06640 [Lactobacillus sp. ESL0731]|uniref:hypothetical protein n=1 Tax=unclassified Lactobacillus TaxID=2620435 RepID=UPI0023F8CEA8|nr:MULTISPECIES: hypothetical protein [unclassified Lactobacillus]WEV50624.1 hypothetical protein OZX63_06635 [Lactobacillus sp. ESL0700]WEV61754.1 hypothetical protein OZX69_06640 [Lactobacillus sp. ESL0731]
MLKKSKKIILTILSLYLIILTLYIFTVINKYSGLNKQGNISINLFFSIQDSGADDNIIIIIVRMLLFTFLGSGLFIYLKNSSFVHQRTGYLEFLQKGMINSFLGGAVISILTNLYEMLLINWFYFPFIYKSHDYEMLSGMRPGYFTTNDLTEILLFIILAAIGWGIFSILVFSVGLLVRKNALYIAVGPILGLILILLPILGNMNNIVWRTFSFSWFLYTLVAPGQTTFIGQMPPINSLVAFLLAGVIYLAVALLLITLWCRKKQHEG